MRNHHHTIIDKPRYGRDIALQVEGEAFIHAGIDDGGRAEKQQARECLPDRSFQSVPREFSCDVRLYKAAAGDMQAIKELADRLDGRPAQILEHTPSDSEPITKIVREIVHMPPPDEIESIEDMTEPLEITFVRSNGNGSGGQR